MRLKFACTLFVLPAMLFSSVVLGFAEQETQRAIVVTAFGSTVPEAITSIEKFAKSLEQDFPDSKIMVAFSSKQVLDDIEDREPKIPSLPEAVRMLVDERVSRIAIFALYVTPGKNYLNLTETVDALNRTYAGRADIVLSSPLVGNDQDAFSLASYLIYSLPGDIKPGDAVVFAGYGSENPGSLVYPALNWALFLQGEKGSLYMVLNLENEDSIKSVLQVLKLNRRKTVWLVPLMTVYGKRASTDVFNTDDKSISSRLHDAGHMVRSHKYGLISNDAVVNLWKNHLRKAMKGW